MHALTASCISDPMCEKKVRRSREVQLTELHVRAVLSHRTALVLQGLLMIEWRTANCSAAAASQVRTLPTWDSSLLDALHGMQACVITGGWKLTWGLVAASVRAVPFDGQQL